MTGQRSRNGNKVIFVSQVGLYLQKTNIFIQYKSTKQNSNEQKKLDNYNFNKTIIAETTNVVFT